jgi:2-isopropylmalate synthase
MAEYVKIFDTTLRDGEQSPGFDLSGPHKLEMAHQLARLGVDVLEAGFPAAGEEHVAVVQQIAREVRGPVIAGLARAAADDIDQCWEALKYAQRSRIHTFLTAADMHEPSHRRGEVVRRAADMVARARRYTADVEFSPIDATRSDWAYVCQVLEAAIDSGATTVNIPDTCGFAQPEEFGLLVSYVREHVPNIERATISVHCHNDLGLAVANSLAAIKAGARQVECCVNGIGERAGNAALEELVMALSVRGDHHRVTHGVNLDQLVPTSELLQHLTGVSVQPNKAIVGANAFAAQDRPDDRLQDARTYATMSTAAIGRSALRRRLEDLGLLLTHEELNHAFAGFKAVADYQNDVTDEDLVRIAHNGRRAAEGVFDAIGHVYR